MKVLIRFDDICPTMDWHQWERAENILNKYRVKPLLGVIPDCKDKTLQITSPRNDFWDWVKDREKEGYGIAMHGYTHVYDNHSRGCINKGYNTEFAGHPYEVQLEKIKNGKEILNAHGIHTDAFFAPSHSYDYNTLKALSASGFKYISDGKTLLPIMRYGIKCLPTRDGSARSLFPQKMFTYVFHSSEWNQPGKAKGYNRLDTICKMYEHSILTFEQFKQIPAGNTILQDIDEKIFLLWDRYAISALRKIKNIINYEQNSIVI